MARVRAIATALLLVAGCRPGEGERCFCEGECRSGLVCAAEGAVLDPGQCVNEISDNLEAGTCIEVGNLGEDTDDLIPPPSFDLGGWGTDPPLTTSVGTEDPMATSGSTTVEMTTIDMTATSSSSTGSTGMDTETATDTEPSTSSSTGSTGPATDGTAG
jgi:hypothetical protein